VKVKRNRRSALLLAATLLAAAPASADWLVTHQGGKVETKGPWKVKGKLVVFTLPDGKLSSLRLTEVDLDASRRTTEEAVAAVAAALAAPPPERPKPKEAKVILTDKDFQRAAPSPAPPTSEETKEGAAAPKGAGEVVVTSWERVQDPGGHVVLTGSIRNDAPNDATGVLVTVLLYDEAGKLLVSGNAVLSSTVLPAGQSGSFRAEFQDVYAFAAAKFEARGMHVLRKTDEGSRSATSDNG
jgi:hypothetical protein